MLTFVCKATYTLTPGESPLADEQEPIHETDQHWSNDRAWSLYASRDVVPIRPRADVVVVGHAFAPDAAPVRSLVARLVVADIDKSVEVWCDRWFTPDGVLHEAARFTKMPLLYERAGGGPDTTNPVGMRHDERDAYGKREVPNLQPHGVMLSSPTQVVEPVGFGPVAPSWLARRSKLGRHASTWTEESLHAQPLPQDIDASYFNAAPRDQQTATLRVGERIVLDNLHPEHRHLVTNLAGQQPQGLVERPGRPPQSAPMRADLLWIHTDRGLCTLTWRGQISIEHPREAGVVSVTLDAAGQALGTGPVEVARNKPPPRSEGTRITVLKGVTSDPLLGGGADPLATSSVLPFAPASSVPAPSSQPSSSDLRLAGTPFTAAGSRPRTDPPDARPMPSSAPPAYAPPPPVAPAPVPPPMAAPPPIESPWAANASRSVAAGLAPVAVGAAVAPAVAPVSRPESAGSTGSAFASSNAAADASGPWTRARADGYRPPVAQPVAQPVAPLAPLAEEAREIIQLIWFDPDAMPRVRRQAAWKRILDELENQPADTDLDDAGLAPQTAEIEDRREVFEILARGESTSGEAIQEALAGGTRESGKFAAPVRLVVGELGFPYDELETLKATVATVTPLIGNDEQLRATVAAAQDLLKLPDLRTAPAVVEGLTTRIQEAFAQGKRAVPQGYLDAQVERALLEQRHYQRRSVFGGRHLRSLLTAAGSSQQIPGYLPDALAQKLPLYQRFKARVIAEIHPQVDQYETHPVALRVVALARALPPLAPPGR